MITKPFELSSTGTTSSHHSTLDKNGVTRSRKRTHLTGSQIASLQASFANNPLPDASIRHGLSLSLGITERTVQIWFQNRRAKARKLEDIANGKSTGTPGGIRTTPLASSTTSLSIAAPTSRYQATFRSMMTPQLFEEMNAATALPPQSASCFRRRPRSTSKPEKPKLAPALLAPRSMSEETDHQRHQSKYTPLYSVHGKKRMTIYDDDVSNLSVLDSSAPQLPPRGLNHDQSNIVTLPVHLLRIGAWTRFANITTATDWGLLCYCTNDHLIWQIQAEGQKFRIHVPFTAINQLSLGSADDVSFGQLNIQLDPQQLIFTMCLNQQYQQDEEWVRCGDFSEEKQASLLFVHEVQGHHDMLQQAVLNMLTALPVLAPKLVLLASPLLDDMSRDMTISPSATPEPSAYTMMNSTATASASVTNAIYPNQHASTLMDKSMMLQAPFYYPPSYDDQHVYNQMMML